MLRISKNYPNLVILGIIVARGDLMGILLFLFILSLIFLFYFVGFIIKLILGIVVFVIGLVVLLFLLGHYRGTLEQSQYLALGDRRWLVKCC